jgi:hypothetical protein
VLGHGDRAEFRAIHAREGDQIGPRVGHGDIQRPAVLLCLRRGCGDAA